jgi:hypothetical protein
MGTSQVHGRDLRTGASDEISSPLNGLFLMPFIESAIDNGYIAIVPSIELEPRDKKLPLADVIERNERTRAWDQSKLKEYKLIVIDPKGEAAWTGRPNLDFRAADSVWEIAAELFLALGGQYGPMSVESPRIIILRYGCQMVPLALNHPGFQSRRDVPHHSGLPRPGPSPEPFGPSHADRGRRLGALLVRSAGLSPTSLLTWRGTCSSRREVARSVGMDFTATRTTSSLPSNF